ncbi:MAG: glycosyltransferase, partial [Ilumatobacteraceae bacterium]
EQALAPFLDDARFRYQRSALTGKGAGLNEGLAMARGSIVALTDDDCELPAGWAIDMARILGAHPRVAVLFCNVVPVPHDRTLGYVPAFERSDTRLLTSVGALRHGLGLGAGMAVRRDVVVGLGGFDASFGPGGRFPSADEWDTAIRVLLAGWHVYETPELSIVHDGYRSFAEGKAHARRDWIALGAVCAKPLRAGHPGFIGIALWMFASKALLPPLTDVVHLRMPRGLARIAGFLSGFVAGLRTPVDTATMIYDPPTGTTLTR